MLIVVTISFIIAAVKVIRTPQVTEETLFRVSFISVGFTGTRAFTSFNTGFSPTNACECFNLPLVLTLQPVSRRL